ncbi:TetR/AcrR family transcriptional regulator [Parvularcula oceani]|uniref:TetR/AcrR family transcriptional regulator n=1 Tax=Parvularcula oceani TaxID=1247963 RepID=UPI0004E1BBCC|nr:TetR/AcrR family transcriptional regulator [Parvularcula oceani]
MSINVVAAPETERYQQKRRLVLEAATRLMNDRGVKGMTFSDVAKAIDLNTTSVTYYYKRKDLLAAAVLEDALDRFAELAERAAEADTPRERVDRFLRGTLRMYSRIRLEEEAPIANLSHIRAMEEPQQSLLNTRYVALFRAVRGFFGDDGAASRPLMTARAHVLLENVFWMQAWLRRYSLGDFERVAYRLFEVLSDGFAPEGARWTPVPLTIDEDALRSGIEGMPDAFLRAATSLINERGYRGASVERIASELNVTKGSFYHHLASKDSLVLECFSRSYGRVSLVQRAAQKQDGRYWDQIASAVTTLLDVQFYSDAPLLRTTALSALPSELRDDVLSRSNRMARRFAGMMIDGITEGSVRAVDPLIAAQALLAMLNAGYELRRWASEQDRETAIADYASTVAYGLFREPVRP